MKIGRKLFIFFAFMFCSYILILKMFHSNVDQNRDVGNKREARHLLQAINPACVLSLKDPEVRTKIIQALVRGDPDGFMEFIEEYFSTCTSRPAQVEHSEISLQFDPVLRKTSEPIGSKFTIQPDPTYVAKATSNDTKTKTKPFCPPQSPLLRGPIDVRIFAEPQKMKEGGKEWNWPPTLEETASIYKDLNVGGFYPGPNNCRCRGHTAIIVPYRDRESHLRYFLYYIHQLLQRQQLCYVIIVAEQDDQETFNKGQMMNTAFNYARDLMPFDCYIFHDVDVIAEDDRILYACREDRVVHYAPFIDKYNYTLFHGITVGAAVGFTEELFRSVNGYSNEYAGWGGEDDDMMERINLKEQVIWRSEENYTRFKMIKHGSDAGNTLNDLRWDRLSLATKRQPIDGLNHLDTIVTDEIKYRTHTRLKVKSYKTGLQREMERLGPKIKGVMLTSPTLRGLLDAKKLPPGLQAFQGIPIYIPGKIVRYQAIIDRNS